MRSRTLTLFLSFFLFGNFSIAQDANEDLQQMQVDVVYLASNLLEGRETGKIGETLAAQYIASRFEQLGLEGGGENGSFFHYFDFKKKKSRCVLFGFFRFSFFFSTFSILFRISFIFF